MLDFTRHGNPNKPAFLLLHAGGMTRAEWDPFLETWAKQFYLVVPSALAHGASPNVPSISISSMADAVVELLEHLNIKKTHIIGSSMGGAIALWLALTEPERINKLIIFRTSYHSGAKVHEEVERMAQPKTWQEWRLDSWMSKQHEPQGGATAWIEVTKKVAATFDPATTDHAHDLSDLSIIRQATLLITGDRDPVVPLSDMLEMYHTIPNAALWVLPKATHFMGTDGWRRHAFEQEVLRFLRSRSAR